MTDDTDRTNVFAAWTSSLLDVTVDEIRRRPGGGRHEAWDVYGHTDDGASMKWFLRADRTGPAPYEHYTLRREAEIYRAVGSTGASAPRVLGVHPDHEAVLLEYVDGDAAFAPLAPEVKSSLLESLVEQLATLHAADPGQLSLPSLHPVRSIPEHVVEELDIWESRLDAAGVPEPFLKACFRWLRDHNPDVEGRPSLVQGDTGPGNLLHDGRRVTALLDFELAHLGDPLEDLAWVATRNAQEPVPDFDEFVSSYARASGIEPDRRRLLYHMLFAELRIAVLGAGRRTAGGLDVRADHGNPLIYGALHRRLTVEAFAAANGTQLATIAPTEMSDTEQTHYYDHALHDLRHLVAPEVTDPFAARRLKSLARVIKYLKEVDRAGARQQAAELAELTALLGCTPSDIAAGRSALDQLVRDGKLSAADLLPYAAAQVTREHELVAPSMGALATRHLPALAD